ncbi:hypothetical protein A3J19_00740 [Candidatus Daviesbacteria bacterium RIFCSPLOWO2_02_FULL_41_8]|uniref:RNA polymerase sigma factor n=2 Tax=Candidatus Daviesiibacteriota TaxID=1752718 RepID=A0A1F5NI08_9BACT|nr:MAG: hypothetical protein A3D83_03515 [Candidatus Daviesbacteria bacterium RIFCSPHIGHO2_02_FULL_41_10]OGE77265.1 MAG: hypothetical protein A3J19_00740 [Candidatus Daviesbacteria bacterium RIFCSPLOWO2_02_FULL_41_8]
MDQEVSDLVHQARKGSKEAYGKLYTLNLKKIYRFIYYMVYDIKLAEDLTQDTFFKVWKSLSKYQEEKGTFTSYLFTVAHNLVIDYSRRKKEFRLDPEIAEAIASGEDIEDQMIRKERQEQVQYALAKLDGPDRQIVMLRFFEELPTREIAKIMDKKDGAIRVALYRALEKLKKILKGAKYE